MRIDSYNKKIASLIVIFPPILLIIYAIVSYTIFFTSETTSDKYILNFYKKEVTKQAVKILKIRVDVVDKLLKFNKNNLSNIITLLNNIKINDEKYLVILKGNKIFFTNANKNKLPIHLIKRVDGVYEDSEYLAVSKINSNFGFKIISFMRKDTINSTVQTIQQKLNESRSKSLRQTIFWLSVIWFLLLFISLWLSTSVYKRLKDYEKSINDTNRDIIFKSRQAMLGELLPMIAHQWRQPLNKISSILMRMRFEIMSGHINPQNLDRQSQMIEDSVDLMSKTIDDFRTFYRPKEEPQEVDLATLVRRAAYFLEEPINKKKIILHKDLMSVKAKLHQNEFLQVLINLIKNATDAVEDGGEINISLKEFEDSRFEEARIELRIEDNGSGIPEDKLEKIFEAHESSKPASMGLGLYMSKIIIEDRLKRKIKAYNTKNGAGFLIILYKNGS